MAYSADDILSDAKLRAFYPTTGGVLADTDIIRLANDELLGILTAREMTSTQGHLAVESTISLVSGQTRYDLPSRAAGGKVRYVALLDSQGNRSNLHPGRPERRVTSSNLTATAPTPQECWFEDGRLVVYPTPTGAGYSIAVGFYIRPGRLTLQANATKATAVAAAGATSLTVSSIPSYLNGATSIDIIRAKPPFQVIAYDAACTSLSTSGTTITLSSGLPYAVQVGDWITLTEESVAPQLPAEAHPLLSARMAKRILQARGDLTNLQAVNADIAELEENIFSYLSNRNEAQVDTFGANALMSSGFARWTTLGGF